MSPREIDKLENTPLYESFNKNNAIANIQIHNQESKIKPIN